MSATSVSDVVAQLKHRLPPPTDQRYDVVLENDLAGRAALAMLWNHRDRLNIYLMTTDPTDRNVVSVQSALATVRNPPVVRIVSAQAAREVSDTSKPLVWAVLPDRTDAVLQTLLQQRESQSTHIVYAEPLVAFQDRQPDQTDPAHELILRDVIYQHAGFLNFFGDRLNPQDLYERAKYPRWFRPPLDFSAAIPSVVSSTIAPDGSLVDTDTFTGTLQLAAPHVQTGYRVEVHFASVLESLEDPSYDIVAHLRNDYVNPNAAGALTIEIEHDHGINETFDIATAPAQLQLPMRAVRPGATLTIAVVAQRDNPRPSWSVASRTAIELEIHPAGTLPAPSLKTRAKSWLRRIRKQPRNHTQRAS